MKRRALFFAASIVLASSTALHADDPDDAYLNFYNAMKEADKLSTNGTPEEALLRYQQAEVALRNLQKNHPDYNPKLVEYREAYVERRLEQMSSSNKVATAKAPPSTQAQGHPAASPSQPPSNPPKPTQ